MQILDQKYLPVWAKQKRVVFDVGHNPNGIVIFYLLKQKLI